MKIAWRGRNWWIRPATALEQETIMDGKYGALYEDRGIILYHPGATVDMQLQAVLHEVAHVMFPEWSAEPHEESKSELGVFERDMKAFLEAVGIDLRPLLGPDP